MNLISHKRRKRAKGERGQALVEFSLVALLFFMMLFGILDMARLFESWMSVQHASREAARYAITGQASCVGISDTPGDRNACIVQKGKVSTKGVSGGGISASDTIVQVTFKAWDYKNVGASTGWSPTPVANKSGKECDQIEVTVRYQHHFMTPLIQVFAPGGVTLYGSQRMTNEPFGACNTGPSGTGDGVG